MQGRDDGRWRLATYFRTLALQLPPCRLRCWNDLSESAPGIDITAEGEEVIVRIKRTHVTPLVSILLHSKFSDGPRIEFLTNPYINVLIEALATFNSTLDDLAGREDMARPLGPTIQFVEKWMKDNQVVGPEATSLLHSALFPYRID